MFEDLSLPAYKLNDDIYAVAADILTVAIEKFVARKNFPENIHKELIILSEILSETFVYKEIQTQEITEDSRRVVLLAALFAYHLKCVGENKNFSTEKTFSEVAACIFAIFDKELFTTEASFEVLEELFPFFSPLCVSMCLANTAAVILPRLSNAIDVEFVTYLKKQHDLKIATNGKASEELVYLHPFYLISVHSETNEILSKFTDVVREKLLPRSDGSYASVAHRIFSFYQEMTRRADSQNSKLSLQNSLRIQQDCSADEQDRQYGEYVSMIARNMIEESMVFDHYLKTGKCHSSKDFEQLVVRLRSLQDFLLLSMREIILAGDSVYDYASLNNSLQEIVPRLLENNEISPEVKDILVCLLPSGFFSFEEATFLWERKIFLKRDQYIKSLRSLLVRFKNLLTSDDKELKREINFLFKEIDTPLSSISTVGIVEGEVVLSEFCFDISKIEKLSPMEYQAALQSFVLRKNGEFYDTIKLLLEDIL